MIYRGKGIAILRLIDYNNKKMFRLRVFQITNLISKSKRSVDKIVRPPTFSTTPRFAVQDDILNDFNKIDPNEEELWASKFDGLFDAKKISSLHDVQEGGYVDVDVSALEKLVPEGLAGEMNEEWSSTQSPNWMIRRTTKLLFRLVEEFESSKGIGKISDKTIGYHAPIVMPGLTDRPAWESTLLQAQYFGANIIHTSSSVEDVNEDNGMVIVKGKGSVVESCVEKILGRAQSIPSSILLTGPQR